MVKIRVASDDDLQFSDHEYRAHRKFCIRNLSRLLAAAGQHRTFDTLTSRYETDTFQKIARRNSANGETGMAACFRYIVNDVSAAIDFYTRHLGFQVEMHPAPGFAEISRGDMHIYLTKPSPGVGGGAKMPSGEDQKPGGWNRIHLLVEQLDATIAALKSAGCHFRSDVIQGVGGKQILLEDPSGNLVELFEGNTAAYRAPGSGSKGARA